MRGFLLPSALVLIVMTVFLIIPQSADSWQTNSPTNNTLAAACGSGHGCFVADDAADADSFMDPHYFDTMLAATTPPISYGTVIPNKPAVACPPKEKYTGSINNLKAAVPGQLKCGYYTRDCPR